jgi:hypothetical protein
MEFTELEIEHDGLNFKIEEDLPEVGVYLYVYRDNKCIKDYLQNNIEICKKIALEEFGVPIGKWDQALPNIH